MAHWWQKPIRAVTLEFPASDVATIDVQGIVDETHRGAVNTLCVFCIGYYPGGTAFYQSRLAPHYPGLGSRDLLAETLNAARRNKQNVIAYVASIWGGREMFLAHTDWAQRHADGTVTSWDAAYNSVAMCPNSPFREYLSEVVQEISKNYEVDGFYFDEPSFQSWCACSYCREKFYSEHHQNLPLQENWEDPIFQQFIAWRYRQISEWRRELCKMVQREDRCAFVQGAFPLSKLTSKPLEISGLKLQNPYRERFAVDWNLPLAHAAYLPDSAEAGDLLHFELYRVSVREPLWWYGISLRYGQSIARGKQVLVLNMMAQTPFDQYGLPESEIRLSIAEILANSGSPLFARYYPDRVDQEAWNNVYAGLQKAAILEPYLAQRESVKYAALLYSQKTVDRFDHTGDHPSHIGCLKGFAKALLQAQVLFDVITEDELSQLNQYRVLVMPNTACLSAETKQAIREYVADGGGVVVSYESGMYDEMGWRTEGDDLADVLGVAYTREPQFSGFDVYMRLVAEHPLLLDLPKGKLVPTGGIQVGVKQMDSQPVATVLGGAVVHYGPLGEESGSQSVLVREAPEGGRAVYFAMPLGNRYLEFGVEAHRELINAAVRWAAGGEAPLKALGAPKTLALTAYTQAGGERLVVHLVNSVRDETVKPITEIFQSQNVSLIVDTARQPSRVTSLLSKELLNWSFEAGKLRVQVPPILDSEVILVEY